MSNRTELLHNRAALGAVDVAIETIGLRVPSPNAQVCLGRARGFMRAAQQMIDRAIEIGVDPVILHRAAPAPFTEHHR